MQAQKTPSKTQKYSAPSGLGGRFSITYTGRDHQENKFLFRVTSVGFEGMTLRYPCETWENNVRTESK